MQVATVDKEKSEKRVCSPPGSNSPITKQSSHKIMVKGRLRNKDLATRHIKELKQTRRRQQLQKTIDFMCKTTALQGHHVF